MEYHEIGEIFEYDGVMLKVQDVSNSRMLNLCRLCYFGKEICDLVDKKCIHCDRSDGNDVIYELVGQSKTKDMKQKTEIELIEEERHKIENDMAGHSPNCTNETIMMNDIIDKLKETLSAKNSDYGSAFYEIFDELGIDYAYGKLREKINRIKVLRNQPNVVENEGLEDALLDTAGYAILTLVELKKEKEQCYR